MRLTILALTLAFAACSALPGNKAPAVDDPGCCSGLDDVNAGITEEGHGDYDEAIRLYSKAITSSTLSGERLANAFALRGSAWREKKDFDRAISDYTEAIRLAPQYDFAFERRGFVHLILANYEAAIDDYTTAITIEPRSAFALYGRGLARRMIGDYTAAEIDIAAATRIDAMVAEKYKRYWIR